MKVNPFLNVFYFNVFCCYDNCEYCSGDLPGIAAELHSLLGTSGVECVCCVLAGVSTPGR